MSEQLRNVKGEHVGDLNQLIVLKCEEPCPQCCKPCPTPKREVIQHTITMKENYTGHDAALLGLLPQFYAGINVPGPDCCHRSPATPLTGNDCLDSGRHYKIRRGSYKKIAPFLGSPSTMEMVGSPSTVEMLGSPSSMEMGR